jgi:SEC-C motif domain protein
MTCPCGRSESIENCCGSIVEGRSLPETAEALMRARYTAYATQRIEYIVTSHHPDTRGDLDRDGIAKLSKEATWLGLEVLTTERGQAGDDEGIVEFKARYQVRGQPMVHHERSLFRRHQGRWYFHSGQQPKPTSLRRSTPKTGRNDPCPCGSGKKYKKCCGAMA